VAAAEAAYRRAKEAVAAAGPEGGEEKTRLAVGYTYVALLEARAECGSAVMLYRAADPRKEEVERLGEAEPFPPLRW
jgi:hypothetical protein